MLLGERGSRVAGRAYRALFVDLGKAADSIAGEIPPRAHVLDVGGGDGEPLNALLDRRDDIRVTTMDVAPVVGQWIEARHAHRVRCLPATRLQDFPGPADELPDVLLIADVVHHIPVPERDALFATIAGLLRQSPDLRVIFKDVEPGHLRATLGYLSDRFVSGDRSVRLISRDELVSSMRRAVNGVRWKETSLFAQDRPNYALVFWR
jgi:hypothetical protein